MATLDALEAQFAAAIISGISNSRRQNSRHKIILSVDFGTTYTGVAFVVSQKSSSDDIFVVNKWPDHSGSSWKTPTRIAYAKENPSKMTADQWGFEVGPGVTSYSWFKLLLDKDTKSPDEHDDPSLSMLYNDSLLKLPPGKSAQDVTTDYLTHLYRYTMELLEKNISAEILDKTPIKCWLTMPAIWSDKAQAATRDAARNAGFGSRVGDSLHVIKEPEAAALVALKSHHGPKAIDPLQPEESILICDCGGGTVDLSTYKITAIEPQVVFEEICLGMGGKCGSTYIDRNFHIWMTTNFGDAYTSLPSKRRAQGSRFFESFEAAKRKFSYDATKMSFGSGKSQRPIEIGPLGMDISESEIYDDEQNVILSPTVMKSFFDPVISKIITLVKEQVNEAYQKAGVKINRVVLVGGFGDSEYLNVRLKEWCLLNGIRRFTCPVDCQNAIVKGAALRGLEGMKPTYVIAKRHYGWLQGNSFREGIDDEADAYIDEYDNRKMCNCRLYWAVKKGQRMDDTASISETLQKVIKSQTHSRTTTVVLYSCSLDDPPDSTRVNPTGVDKIGDIEVDMSSYEWINLSPKYNTRLDKMVWLMSFTVTVNFRSSEGDILSFSAKSADGNTVGAAKIRFK